MAPILLNDSRLDYYTAKDFVMNKKTKYSHTPMIYTKRYLKKIVSISGNVGGHSLTRACLISVLRSVVLLTTLSLSIGLLNTSLHLIVATVMFKPIYSARSMSNYAVVIMAIL